VNHDRRVIHGHEHWLAQCGETELIGGWAEVALDADFAALLKHAGYQVLVTPHDPVHLFVQNRTARSFEIHALPSARGARQVPTRCSYWVVGWRTSDDISERNSKP